MTNFELWQKGLEINKPEVWQLEKSKVPNTGLYMSHTKYLSGNNYFYTSPVYHIWIKDEHTVIMNEKEAYDIYRERVGKLYN